MYYLFSSLLCLALCGVFVWLSAKRMRSGRPYDWCSWLAQFLGVMIVMGVGKMLEEEGIRTGVLVIMGGVALVFVLLSFIIKALGTERKGMQAPVNESRPTEQQEKFSKRRGTFSIIGWIALGVCMGSATSLWVLHQKRQIDHSIHDIRKELSSLGSAEESILVKMQKQKSYVDHCMSDMDDKHQREIKNLNDSFKGIQMNYVDLETFFKEKMEMAMNEINVIKSNTVKQVQKSTKDNYIGLNQGEEEMIIELLATFHRALHRGKTKPLQDLFFNDAIYYTKGPVKKRTPRRLQIPLFCTHID